MRAQGATKCMSLHEVLPATPKYPVPSVVNGGGGGCKNNQSCYLGLRVMNKAKSTLTPGLIIKAPMLRKYNLCRSIQNHGKRS